MSNEKQTAMRQLIEHLEKEAAFITDNDAALDRGVRLGYRMSIEKAKELLALEKQQIVEAFNNGLTIKIDGEQYYSQTYNQ